VHNGIYEKTVIRHYEAKHPDWPKHLVLFLGRVTFQKGPDYFVQAAARVVPHVPDVRFVVAGAGDMLGHVQQMTRDLGVEKHFLFPGFLRGNAVEEMFSVADLYVMPSVSEPFGIAALEAINFDTPVLLSRQSGVSEVLEHSLKFDFWDVDRLADLIINGLIHEELRTDMIEMARKELMRLRWDASASKVMDVYKRLAA
jgi:glycogen(starch) synthase